MKERHFMQNTNSFKHSAIRVAMAGITGFAVILTSGCASFQTGAESTASSQVKIGYDFAFAIKGDTLAMPVQVFSDAKNTYIQTRPNQSIADDGITLPADATGQVLALRFKRQSNYLVLTGKPSQFYVNTKNGNQAQIAYAGEVVVAVLPPAPVPLPAQVPATVAAVMPVTPVAVVAPTIAVAPVAVVKPAAAPIPLPIAASVATPIVQATVAKPVAVVPPPTLAPTPVASQVATPVSVAASLSTGEVKVEAKPVKAAENAGLKLYAIGGYEKTALQVLGRWATVAGYRLILNDVQVTSKFPNHSAEYVDLPLLPEHYKLPINDTLEAAIASLAKPFGSVDMSSVQFVVIPQTNIKTIIVSSRATPLKPVAAPAVATQPAAAQAQVSPPVAVSPQSAIPAVATFSLNPSDKSLIGVLTRWAKQAGYQTQLNGTAVDSATFPVHSAAFTDFGLTQAAQSLKPVGTFVAGLQGIMGAFANQDLSQFKMQLLSEKRVLVITSNDPTKVSPK